jgi:hypothetical protein
MRPQSLSHQILHHLLDNRLKSTLITLKIAGHALLGVLGQDVNLDVDAVTLLLLGQDNLLLGVRDQHDLPPTLGIVHGRDGQARPVEGDEAFVDDVAQHVLVLGTEPQRHGVTIRGPACDGRHAVDVALDEVAAHARVSAHSALEVHPGALRQLAQVCQAQRLRGDADNERRRGRRDRGRGQAHAVDGDAVAEDGTGQQRRGRRQRDGQGGAAGRVLGVELRYL